MSSVNASTTVAETQSTVNINGVVSSARPRMRVTGLMLASRFMATSPLP